MHIFFCVCVRSGYLGYCIEHLTNCICFNCKRNGNKMRQFCLVVCARQAGVWKKYSLSFSIIGAHNGDLCHVPVNRLFDLIGISVLFLFRSFNTAKCVMINACFTLYRQYLWPINLIRCEFFLSNVIWLCISRISRQHNKIYFWSGLWISNNIS